MDIVLTWSEDVQSLVVVLGGETVPLTAIPVITSVSNYSHNPFQFDFTNWFFEMGTTPDFAHLLLFRNSKPHSGVKLVPP